MSPAPVIVFLTGVRNAINERLEDVEPFQILIFTALSVLLAQQLTNWFVHVRTQIEDKGSLQWIVSSFIFLLNTVPGVSSLIENEKKKAALKLQGPMLEKEKTYQKTLPIKGVEKISDELVKFYTSDQLWQGKCSGTVYMGGSFFQEHVQKVSMAYSMFSHSNPLHADIFPSVVRFENEVVAMTASLLGSQSDQSGGEVCGNMTSGGSESILMAVKSTRDYMKAKRGIHQPEMIIAESAHSAYDKAAQYFGIRLRRAPVGPDFKADVRKMEKLVNRNTILIVGSAPGFPHGVIDPIEKLGKLALRKRICLHVDLCLGGFVLPFAKKLGYPIPPFDFEVPGVTSISVDTHKYGLAPKGSSVVLYRNHEIRKHQFVAVTDWSGGLYVSPSSSGSRPGGLIAAAWTSLMSLGESGFLEITQSIMTATRRIIEGIQQIDGLYILGKPEMTVVAFGSQKFDIYEVNDIMTEKGWSLNALQRPPSIHICVTLQHVTMVEAFLKDLSNAVWQVKRHPNSKTNGMAPIYGQASRITDRSMVGDLLVAYMDSVC